MQKHYDLIAGKNYLTMDSLAEYNKEGADKEDILTKD